MSGVAGGQRLNAEHGIDPDGAGKKAGIGDHQAIGVVYVAELIDDGKTGDAAKEAEQLLARFPRNPVLQDLYAAALSADGQDEAARDYVRTHLASDSLDGVLQLMWLNRQARVELHAADPSALVLDLAVQKVLATSPNDLQAATTKAAAQVMRGQSEAGGELLADTWRRNGGQVRDEELLAYLAIAAHRVGNRDATDRFRSAFSQINRSARLDQLVSRYAS